MRFRRSEAHNGPFWQFITVKITAFLCIFRNHGFLFLHCPHHLSTGRSFRDLQVLPDPVLRPNFLLSCMTSKPRGSPGQHPQQNRFAKINHADPRYQLRGWSGCAAHRRVWVRGNAARAFVYFCEAKNLGVYPFRLIA